MNASLASISLSIIFSLFGVVTARSFDERKVVDTPPTTVSVTTPNSTHSTTTTSTTSTVPTPPAARCSQWWSLARRVGFDEHQMMTLDRIMFRESRCDELQLNPRDPNGGSIGLTQINRFWCLPSRYYASGYLQHVDVLDDCDDLYDAETNLRAALALVEYSKSESLDQWAQWAWLDDDASESD